MHVTEPHAPPFPQRVYKVSYVQRVTRITKIGWFLDVLAIPFRIALIQETKIIPAYPVVQNVYDQ